MKNKQKWKYNYSGMEIRIQYFNQVIRTGHCFFFLQLCAASLFFLPHFQKARVKTCLFQNPCLKFLGFKFGNSCKAYSQTNVNQVEPTNQGVTTATQQPLKHIHNRIIQKAKVLEHEVDFSGCQPNLMFKKNQSKKESNVNVVSVRVKKNRDPGN